MGSQKAAASLEGHQPTPEPTPGDARQQVTSDKAGGQGRL